MTKGHHKNIGSMAASAGESAVHSYYIDGAIKKLKPGNAVISINSTPVPWSHHE